MAGQSEAATGPVELGGLYDLYRHSMSAVTRHEATPYAGDITFLREREDTGFLPWLRRDMTDYWRDVCLGDLSVVDVPGDHFSCLRPPHVRRVADVLAEVHREAR